MRTTTHDSADDDFPSDGDDDLFDKDGPFDDFI